MGCPYDTILQVCFSPHHGLWGSCFSIVHSCPLLLLLLTRGVFPFSDIFGKGPQSSHLLDCLLQHPPHDSTMICWVWRWTLFPPSSWPNLNDHHLHRTNWCPADEQDHLNGKKTSAFPDVTSNQRANSPLLPPTFGFHLPSPPLFFFPLTFES